MSAGTFVFGSLGSLILLAQAACIDAPVAPEEISAQAFTARSPAHVHSEPVVVKVGHDGSFHAKDAIRPRSTVITPGTTVNFLIAAGHDLSVYEPGITPASVDASLLEPAGVPFDLPLLINDPVGRLARSPLNFGPPLIWSYTFEEPGLYLVICDVLPHFVAAKMYAWIRVG